MDNISGTLALSLSFAESVFLKVGGEHYYNDAVSGDRSMFFLDASLSWRTKRLELTLECRNLLGTDTYSSPSTVTSPHTSTPTGSDRWRHC